MTLVEVLAWFRGVMHVRNTLSSAPGQEWGVEDFNTRGRHVLSSHFARSYDETVPALEMRVKHASGKIFVVSVREER